MLGLDERLAGLGGGGVALYLAVALLLGLRHATDPDHMTAVATLVICDPRGGVRRARALGLAWGLGHAATLTAVGVPVILIGGRLPDAARRAAEVAIGAVIVALAARLLMRWRTGRLHLHVHDHHGVVHAHPHAHEGAAVHDAAGAHEHRHAGALGRSPVAAFGIGLVHGLGGSGALGVLVLAEASGPGAGLAALALFAAGTAGAMALLSAALAGLLARDRAVRRLPDVMPALGTAGVLFGAWYALAALDAVPYPL